MDFQKYSSVPWSTVLQNVICNYAGLVIAAELTSGTTPGLESGKYNLGCIINNIVTMISYQNFGSVANPIWVIVSQGGGGSTGVSSFNTRTGAVTLNSTDIDSALGYNPNTNFIQNQNASPQAATYNINGNGIYTRQTGTVPILSQYTNLGYNVSSYVGIIGNPELNCSFNMNYSAYPGVHIYSNSAYPAIWTAHSTTGYGIQYAPSGITQTGIGTFTLTGGSGYTDSVYTNVPLTGGSGSGTATITVSGGIVTAVTVNLLSTGYTVGDNVSASGIGPGTGFNMLVTAVYNDIWTSSGSKYLMITDLNSHIGFGFSNGSPFGDARVQANRTSGKASYSGITDLVLEGNQNAGTSGNVLISSLSNSLLSLNAGGGHTIFGGAGTPGAVVHITGSYSSVSGTARGFYNQTTVIPTANNDVLIGNEFLNTFAVGTGALTATITTNTTSASNGTFDNSASTAITGSGSGQTWQVTVSGGIVTAIVPGSTAVGGIGYSIGDTFSVTAAPGAVFTVASLGYTGVQSFSTRFNNPILFITSNPALRTNGMIWYQSPSLFGYFNNTLVNFTAPTAVGTVTAGTWNATAISVLHGGTGTTTSTGTGSVVLSNTPTLVTPNLGIATASNLIFTNNAITAVGNAATVPVNSMLSTVTNNSAATITITMTVTSAVDGQLAYVRVLDFSGVAETITWVNTENSTVTAPTTSNGSTTLPLLAVFQYNGNTSKWRCILKA